MPTLVLEEVPTLEDLPTPEPGVANAPEALALPEQEALAVPEEALATDEEALAIEELDVANTQFEVPTRLEPRRNKHGKLRGIAWRQRNKERKAVWYVGINSKEPQKRKQWEELKGRWQ